MQPKLKWILEYLDSQEILPEMEKAIDMCVAWGGHDHGYESKNARIKEWGASSCDFYDIVSRIFAGVIMSPEGITYQALIGFISGSVTCADPLARAQCASEIIAITFLTDLIVIEQITDKTLMITTDFDLTIDIPEFPQHAPVFKKSQVMTNQILGNSFKQHDEDACIAHINTMNAIQLCLETRIVDSYSEFPFSDPETDEQVEQWHQFVEDSYHMYRDVIDSHNNKFYLEHANDTRGRCYCKGYYINYQGSSYKKAIVQLANKEVVKL